MKCKNCNAELMNPSRFCPCCGVMLQQDGWNPQQYNGNYYANTHGRGLGQSRPYGPQSGVWNQPQNIEYAGENARKKFSLKKMPKKAKVALGVLAALILLGAMTPSSEETGRSKTVSRQVQTAEARAENGRKKNAKAASVTKNKESAKKVVKVTEVPVQPQKTLEEILKEFETGGHRTLDIEQDVLVQYGAYYPDCAAHTVVTVDSKFGKTLKAHTSDTTYRNTLVMQFDAKEDIRIVKNHMKVEVVGIVDTSTEMDSEVTINHCQIVKTGEEVQPFLDSVTAGKEQQIADAEALKKAKEEEEAQAAAQRKQEEEQAEAQRREEFKASCAAVSYEEVARNPGNYEGQNVVITGQVIQVSEAGYGVVVMRVDVGGGNIWYVTYCLKDGEARILEDDTVTLYGTCNGVESYQSIFGQTITIPSLSAQLKD